MNPVQKKCLYWALPMTMVLSVQLPNNAYGAENSKDFPAIDKKAACIRRLDNPETYNKPVWGSLDLLITVYESKIKKDCALCEWEKNNDRCRDRMLSLAGFYYQKGRHSYMADKVMYESNAKTDTAVVPLRKPVPDYSKSIDLFERVMPLFPEDKDISGIYYLLYKMHLEMRHNSLAQQYLDALVRKYPKWTPSEFTVHSMVVPLDTDHPENIREADYDPVVWKNDVHLQKGESFILKGDREAAKSVFKDFYARCLCDTSAPGDLCEAAEKYLEAMEYNLDKWRVPIRVLQQEAAKKVKRDPESDFMHISGDITLLDLKPGQRYIVDYDLFVPENKKATVPKGVSLYFKVYMGLTVSGEIQIDGANDAPVLFTSADEISEGQNNAHPFYWRGVLLKEKSRARIANLCLQNSTYGIRSATENVSLRNCVFRGNGQFDFTVKGSIIKVDESRPFFYDGGK